MSSATEKSELMDLLKDAGYSVSSFARRFRFCRSTTHAALNGSRDGVLSRRIRRQILKVVKPYEK